MSNNEQWWHDDMSPYASQLSKGVLNEMRHRILTSNIQKEKLERTESTDRMKAFFKKEIVRYSKRKENLKKKVKDAESAAEKISMYKDMIKELVQCNVV
jgi:hypothetical protein